MFFLLKLHDLEFGLIEHNRFAWNLNWSVHIDYFVLENLMNFIFCMGNWHHLLLNNFNFMNKFLNLLVENRFIDFNGHRHFDMKRNLNNGLNRNTLSGMNNFLDYFFPKNISWNFFNHLYRNLLNSLTLHELFHLYSDFKRFLNFMNLNFFLNF